MRDRIADFFSNQVGTGIFVPDYAWLLSTAIVVFIYFVVQQAEKRDLDLKKVFLSCLITVGFALVGARLYIVFRDFGYYWGKPIEIIYLWKGTASFGAYICGLIGAIIASRWQNLSLPKFLDCCAPSLALAISLGRLGCFLNGCCYGKMSGLPWALRFSEGSMPVHPTQLYASVYALILFFGLRAYRKYQRCDGELVALFFIFYPLGRFLNEFLRGDDRGDLFGLSVPQFFCLVAVFLSTWFLLSKIKAGRIAPGEQ